MKMFLQKQGNHLIPVYASDLDNMKLLREGVFYLADVKEDRNPRFHKKFFALLKLTLDNLPEQMSTDIQTTAKLLVELKAELGYYSEEHTRDGEIYRVLKSISFEKMDNTEFRQFYSDCINVILSKYLVGVDPQDLEDMIIDYI